MAAVIGSPRARLAGRDGGLESDWAPSRGLAPLSFAYLYLGLANASAFSPAGTMPMSRARRPQWGCSCSSRSPSSAWWSPRPSTSLPDHRYPPFHGQLDRPDSGASPALRRARAGLCPAVSP